MEQPTFKINDRVRDSEGYIGTIYSIEDLHNIEIRYDCGGLSLMCIVEGCMLESRLEKIN